MRIIIPVSILICLFLGACATRDRHSQSPVKPASELSTIEKYNLAVVARALRSGALPQLVHWETPEYPYKIRAMGIQGKVEFAFTVNEEGRVVAVKVLRSPSGVLSAAVVKAVRQLRFRPMKRDGKPTPFRAQQAIVFKVTAGETSLPQKGGPSETAASERSLRQREAAAIRYKI